MSGDEAAEAQELVVVQNRANPRVDPPGELVLDSNREVNFGKFRSRWQSYYILSRLDQEADDHQTALLMYTMDADAATAVESS